MVFQNPIAFVFILVIPLLFVLRKIGIFSRISFPLVLSDWNGKSFEWKRRFSGFLSIFSGFMMILAYLSLVVAFSDPVIRHQEKVYTSRGMEILFVIDTSPSMASRDIPYLDKTINSIEAAKIGIKTLVKSEEGATFALIAMASEAAAVVPPTNDHDVFLERLESLQLGMLGDGSAIGIGLSSAVYHLASTKAPKKCIVLLTDGENNAGSVHPLTAAKLAKQNNIDLYVLGIGTRGTVPIEYVDPKTGKVRSGYYESSFDKTPLEKLAFASSGRYFGIESLNELSDSLSLISEKENVVQTFHLKTTDEPCFDRFLFLSAIFFIVGWIIKRVFLSEIL